MSDPLFDVQTDAVASINFFNEFVYEHLSMQPSQKTADLITNVQNFFTSKGSIWAEFLLTALTCVLFEDNRNIWIFQKWLYSTLVIILKHQDSQVVSRTVITLLSAHESNEQRKTEIMNQFSTVLQETSFKSLDQKSKDAFSRKFQSLKSFVVNF